MESPPRRLPAAHQASAAGRHADVHQPAVPRVEPLPPAARAQPGRTGTRGATRPSRRRGGSAGRCSSRVGYSTCHWCHVMEEESFEDEEIAALPQRALRRDQGRPRGAARRRRDLHERRADAHRRRRLADDRLAHAGAQAVLRRHLLPGARRRPRRHGRLPDAAPEARGRSTASDPQQGRRVGATLARSDRREPLGAVGSGERRRTAAVLRGAAAVRLREQLRSDATAASRGAPKFPQQRCPIASCCALPPAHRRRSRRCDMVDASRSRRWPRAASTTRSAAASTATRPTRDWLVPHFEKMLYDNALLAVAYLEGVPGDRAARTSRGVAREILALRRARHDLARGRLLLRDRRRQPRPDGRARGGLVLHLDAGRDRARRSAPNGRASSSAYYGVSAGGNFDGRSILHTPRPLAAVATRARARRPRSSRRRSSSRARSLYDARAQRPPPLRDEKILAAGTV